MCVTNNKRKKQIVLMTKRMQHLTFIAVLLVTAIIGFTGIDHTPTANAAVKIKTVKTIPKRMRGTWYHYYKGTGLYKAVIKKHSFSNGLANQKLDKFPGLQIMRFTEKHKHTSYAFRKKTSSGLSAAESLTPYTKKINGKKRAVLVEPVQGAGERPAVFTHFKTKHIYTMPISFQLNHMA